MDARYLSKGCSVILARLFGALAFLLLLVGCSHHIFAQIYPTSMIRASSFPLLEEQQTFQPWDIETDSLGHAFFVGASTAYRFNGTKLTPLTPHSSLENQNFTALTKDRFGRLWTKGYIRGIGQIVGDSILPYPFNDKIEHLPRSNWENTYFDSDSTLHFSPRGSGHYSVSKNGELKEIAGKSSGIHGFVVTQLPDGTLFHFSIFQPKSKVLNTGLKIYYQHSNGDLTVVATTPHKKPIYESTLISHNDQTWTLSPGNQDIFKAKKDSLISSTTLPYQVIKLFEDSHKNMWIGTVQDGMLQVTNERYSEAKKIAEKGAVAIVAEDLNGGLWMKSNKVFFAYIPNNYTLRYSTASGHLATNNCAFISSDSKRWLYLNKRNMLSIVEGDSVQQLPVPLGTTYNFQEIPNTLATALHFDSIGQKVYTGAWNQVSIWDGVNWDTLQMDTSQFNESRVRKFQSLPDSTVIGCTRGELFFIKNRRFSKVIPIPQIGYIRDFAITPSGEIWVGGVSGIIKWDSTGLSCPLKAGNCKENQLTGVVHLSYALDRIWVQTSNEALFTIRDGQIESVMDADKESEHMTELFVAPNGQLWALSSKEDRRLINFSAVNDSIQLKRYAIEHLISRFGKAKKSLAVIDGKILMGNKGGVFGIPIDKLTLWGIPPNIHIFKVLVNQQRMPNQKRYELAPDQNSLYLNFEAISYRLKSPTFRCRLVGLDSNWFSPEYQVAQYTNLDPGNYTFQVQAKIKSEPWGEMKEVEFFIQTPYWQTLWFRTLMTLLASMLIGIAIFLWNRAQRRRMTLQIDKLKAEQRALRAQMNPHFMFNAMSSIQDLVFNQDRIFAVNNIALFAKLMRKILAHSAQEIIPLTEEIETLKLYLKLEALRFEERFDYHIEVDKKIDPTTRMVPPLLLQPFVENAIKHGLLNKEPKGGSLQIIFKLQEESLLCIIEDDGVGRKESGRVQAQKNPAHRSFGTQSVNERIDLMNKQQEKKITLNVTDLYHGETPCGTRIEFLIP